MMTEAIIIAIITAVAAVTGQWMLARKSTMEREKNQAIRDQKIDDQLQAVKERLDEHNGYAKKFADLSGDIQAMKLSIVKLDKDIEYIKKGKVSA